jgi:transcriptional regulator with XRE-family HTH domain
MENLQKIREQKGMTREQLCVKADVKYLTLRAYELKYRNPKLDAAKRLAEVLGVSIEDLG